MIVFRDQCTQVATIKIAPVTIFGKLIWETKSKLIMMLYKLEIDFSGCSEYFPKRRDQIVQHGDFVIKNVSIVDRNVSKKKSEINVLLS